MSAAMDIQNGQGASRPKAMTVWSWLRRALLAPEHGVAHQHDRRDPPAGVRATAPVPREVAVTDVAAASCRGNPQAKVGVILPFPIHGEALLVKLAEVLRNRIADRGSEWDAVLPQMSRWPRSRLSIDLRTYIEFHQECGEYRVVIEASAGTKVILETADFDVVVDYVLQYVAGRLTEPAALEAAS